MHYFQMGLKYRNARDEKRRYTLYGSPRNQVRCVSVNESQRVLLWYTM